MTSPHDARAASRPDPAWLARPPAPGFAFAPPRPHACGRRVTFGILLALASGFVGSGWLAFAGLLLAYRNDASRASDQFWVLMGVVGLVIVLSGIGGIGTAVTARRPIHDRLVRCWVWMSCVFGGLGAAIFVSFLVYLQASGA